MTFFDCFQSAGLCFPCLVAFALAHDATRQDTYNRMRYSHSTQPDDPRAKAEAQAGRQAGGRAQITHQDITITDHEEDERASVNKEIFRESTVNALELGPVQSSPVRK
ncbi:uncharacterized protein RAG0_11232 [Rhynchosporium agropyri]|uniref:Uncharacterized protein n=1 Tax=Rhynchosporium agropyri TaxID=914238 RepID=A0A1E1L394_9HELO|nr:uncharacterized protein RAG0_11232 [Rhynchosporium agropyri]